MQAERGVSNIVIKQARVNNVPVVKLEQSIISAKLEQVQPSYQMQLIVRSTTEFLMNCYMFISESKPSNQGQLPKYDKASGTSSKALQFKCPAGDAINIPVQYLQFNEETLKRYESSSSVYPLIVELQGINNKQTHQLIYFYKFERDKGIFHSHLAKELINHQGEVYEVNDLFGIDNTVFNQHWNPNVNEDRECVVCFSNTIDTIILPCRHMCVCGICCQHILGTNQKLCPLCRKDINNYLTLDVKVPYSQKPVNMSTRQPLTMAQHPQEEEQKSLINIRNVGEELGTHRVSEPEQPRNDDNSMLTIVRAMGIDLNERGQLRRSQQMAQQKTHSQIEIMIGDQSKVDGPERSFECYSCEASFLEQKKDTSPKNESMLSDEMHRKKTQRDRSNNNSHVRSLNDIDIDIQQRKSNVPTALHTPDQNPDVKLDQMIEVWGANTNQEGSLPVQFDAQAEDAPPLQFQEQSKEFQQEEQEQVVIFETPRSQGHVTLEKFSSHGNSVVLDQYLEKKEGVFDDNSFERLQEKARRQMSEIKQRSEMGSEIRQPSEPRQIQEQPAAVSELIEFDDD